MDVNSLAYFGGSPIFSTKLHVGQPNILHRDRFIQRVNEALDNKWLTNNGPFVQELEKQLANYIQCKHCILVNSGTSALEILIKALGLKGEVILPSFTFIATAHALKWFGLTPVFADINPDTHNIDPESVKNLITRNTTGIIGVHIWGRACPVDDLVDVADEYNLKLIFDAAHAFGCTYKGRMIGNFGDAEIFSFHATKFFNTLEGGAVATNNDNLALLVREIRDFGYTKDHEIVSIGTNGKMNEISAAMGLTMIECLDEIIETNFRNYKKYHTELAGIPGIQLINYDQSEKNNYQYIVMEIDDSTTGITRDELRTILLAENVLARSYFSPACHRTIPYYDAFVESGNQLPNTEHLTTRILSLPNGLAIGAEEITKICDLIRYIVTNPDIIRKKLNRN